jgi:hypothetical protein
MLFKYLNDQIVPCEVALMNILTQDVCKITYLSNLVRDKSLDYLGYQRIITKSLGKKAINIIPANIS